MYGYSMNPSRTSYRQETTRHWYGTKTTTYQDTATYHSRLDYPSNPHATNHWSVASQETSSKRNFGTW